MYALATEIYGLPGCYEALQQAIQDYRACAAYTVADKTDAAFNLAQALQTLGEYVSETESSSSASQLSRPERIWQEARQILEGVRLDQTSRLAGSSGIPSSTDIDGSVDTENIDITDQSSTAEAAAVEEQVMTPSTVIETILAAIQADMSIAETTSQLALDDILSLLDQASNLNGTDGYMTSEIDSAKHDLVKVQTRIQLDKGEVPGIQDLQNVVEQQRQAASSQRRPNPAELSDLADTLVLSADAILASSHQPVNPTDLLKEAVALYQQARSILGNSFQRPSSTPAHHTSALISANWQATANALAMLALMARGAGDDFRTLLADAKSAAGEALNSSEGPFKSQAPNTNGIGRFARTLRSAVRDDYRTVIATRDSVLSIARIFLLERLLLDTQEAFGEQGRGLQALMKATWPDPNDLKQALDEYVNSFVNDSIGRLCAGQGLSEQEEWTQFIQAA